MSLHGHWQGLARIGNDLRALGQYYLGIQGFQSHQLFTVVAQAILTAKPALTDKAEILFLTDHPIHIHVLRRHRSVGVLAYNDEPLLRP